MPLPGIEPVLPLPKGLPAYGRGTGARIGPPLGRFVEFRHLAAVLDFSGILVGFPSRAPLTLRAARGYRRARQNLLGNGLAGERVAGRK